MLKTAFGVLQICSFGQLRRNPNWKILTLHLQSSAISKRFLSTEPATKEQKSSSRLAAAEAPPEIVTKNISFRPALDSPLEPQTRPIVLVYGWLVAKSRHIHKYGDFYLGKGFDVVHVKVSPEELLRPHSAQKVVGDVLNFINTPIRQKQPILYHGFSVGGYLYGETLVKIHHDPLGRYHDVGLRLCGQIFDSPVDYDNVPYGVAQAITPNKVGQKVLKNSLDAYLKLFFKSTTIHYIRSSLTTKANNLHVPSLFLYSHNDKVAGVRPIEDLLNIWVKEDIEVYGTAFNGSTHVSHFHAHPVQYIGCLNFFLEKLGLGPASLKSSGTNEAVNKINARLENVKDIYKSKQMDDDFNFVTSFKRATSTLTSDKNSDKVQKSIQDVNEKISTTETPVISQAIENMVDLEGTKKMDIKKGADEKGSGKQEKNQ